MARRLQGNIHLLRTFPQRDLSETRMISVHEVGHILSVHCSPFSRLPRMVTIVPSPDFKGGVFTDNPGLISKRASIDPLRRAALRSEILFCLGGETAVEVLTGKAGGGITLGTSGDYEQVFKLLTWLYGDDEAMIDRQLQLFTELSYRLFWYKPTIRALETGADYLLEHRHLENEAVSPLLDLIDRALGSRFIREHTARIERVLFADDLSQV
ncbi:MAG: hypothetical protein KJZ86_13765 [Caldilineaceae bacterium]|nr:hypothetical protein [Caldilineaceae bacterium]